MAELEGGPDTELEDRLRTSLAIIAPPAPSSGVSEAVRGRVVRRRRRTRGVIGAALVVLVGGGTVGGLALTSGPPLAAPPPAPVASTPSTTSPARSPAGADGNPSTAGTSLGALEAPAAETPPCPAGQGPPSMATGRFCGPTPGPGNGLGPGGECTGQETGPPCGAGVVPGYFYAFTVPGTCDGLVLFDGRRWVSELPPPKPVPNFDVWIQLGTDGSVRWIAPRGSVGLEPSTGQPSGTCRG